MHENLTAHAMAVTPGPLIAAGYAEACKHFTSTPSMDEFAQRVLLNCWLELAPMLTEKACENVYGKMCAAITFLDMYFQARGDWEKMRVILAQNSGLEARASDGISALISQKIIRDAEAMQRRERKTPI